MESLPFLYVILNLILRSFHLWHIGKQRKLYLEESSSKYWDRVDHYLEVIRQRADGDVVKIATYVTSSRSVLVLIMASSVFKNLIKKDMDTFGSKDSDKIPDDLNHFQQNVEDSLDNLS